MTTRLEVADVRDLRLIWTFLPIRQRDRHGLPVPKSPQWSRYRCEAPLTGRDSEEGVVDYGGRSIGESDCDLGNFLELPRRGSESLADVSGRRQEIASRRCRADVGARPVVP